MKKRRKERNGRLRKERETCPGRTKWKGGNGEEGRNKGETQQKGR